MERKTESYHFYFGVASPLPTLSLELYIDFWINNNNTIIQSHKIHLFLAINVFNWQFNDQWYPVLCSCHTDTETRFGGNVWNHNNYNYNHTSLLTSAMNYYLLWLLWVMSHDVNDIKMSRSRFIQIELALTRLYKNAWWVLCAVAMMQNDSNSSFKWEHIIIVSNAFDFIAFIDLE